MPWQGRGYWLGFRFHVEIDHPLTGLIVRYCGWLVPETRHKEPAEIDEARVL
jgi:hypothetical protein